MKNDKYKILNEKQVIDASASWAAAHSKGQKRI